MNVQEDLILEAVCLIGKIVENDKSAQYIAGKENLLK